MAYQHLLLAIVMNYFAKFGLAVKKDTVYSSIGVVEDNCVILLFDGVVNVTSINRINPLRSDKVSEEEYRNARTGVPFLGCFTLLILWLFTPE